MANDDLGIIVPGNNGHDPVLDEAPKGTVLLSIELLSGQMHIKFASVNIALLSHAVKLAEMQLENMIITSMQPKVQPEVPKISPDLMRKIRGH